MSFQYTTAENEYIDAVRGVSLTVYDGEFISVIGHNGSGKSTLAKMLNGLLLPSSGKVLVYGVDTQDDRAFREVRSAVGMVFQNPDNQIIASKVEDDIAFGPENLGVPREEIIERVNWALAAVGMEHERNSTPYRLSGGQKQRVAIAGVLALKPKVLVLDESTAMLDPKGRAEVLGVVKQLNANGMAVIMITHYMEEALSAKRLLVMNEGKIAADDTPQNVFANYDRLREINLSIPPATAIARSLGLRHDIMTEEELAHEICKLLKRNN